ncbi:Microtubule-associated serine/threonine-protein kinase 2 [Triplophysa tibetana]|uniref:Microtubule-associated serine/threonine-protein kinase 2 n=1 Tax=Triplophysa tibetana TaxID=1572043 RepID=A0A5A9NTB1_9TELE|nr:Microtubule-associated serine/threonine-protein kinase 2 [Triplophysa tibetana]
MKAKDLPAPPPLLFRKLSNPDLSPAAGKTKLQRQLSQDDSRARRSSMAGMLTGKQLLPLSSSMHGGVSQLAWQQHAGEPNNLVRMRSHSFGQSAPSLTAGQIRYISSVSTRHGEEPDLFLKFFASDRTGSEMRARKGDQLWTTNQKLNSGHLNDANEAIGFETYTYRFEHNNAAYVNIP